MKTIELKTQKNMLYVSHSETGNCFRISAIANLSKKFVFSNSIKDCLKWLSENHPELLL